MEARPSSGFSTFNVLITPSDLSTHLFDHTENSEGAREYTLKENIPKDLKVIDASLGGDAAREEFHKRAIPTARFLDVMQNLKDNEGDFPNTFPTAEVVEAELGKLGIDVSDNIILYSQPGKLIGATRAFVILASYGFQHVRILDGGLKKYEEDGFPVSEGKDYDGDRSSISGLISPNHCLANVYDIVRFSLGKSSDVQLIDTRPANAFNGEATDNIPGCRQGNVKGSISIPASEFVDNQTGAFKSNEELEEISAKYKIDSNKQTIVMCRTGMAATQGIVALLKAGFNNVQLYDGSWSEFGSM